jgi:hypothetical protein
VQLTARLIALLAATAAVGFGAAFLVARSGADDGAATTPARTTLPSIAAGSIDQTVRGVGAAAALPDLRRRPRTRTQRTVTPTSQPPATTTQPRPPPPTQPPTTTQVRPPPTTTQSAPPVTTQG